MLRVCHILSGDLWAGAEVMAFNLLRSMGENPEVKVSALLLSEGRLAAELRGLGLDVQVVQEDRHSFPKLLQQSRLFLRERTPHIIHSHRYKENILAFLSTQGLPGVRLVATQHGLPEHPSGRQSWGGRMVAGLNRFALARHFSRVIVVSENIRDYFVGDFGISPERIRVIHNGIQLPNRPLPRTSRPELLVGSAGRFFPVKDYALMVEVAHAAVKKSSAMSFELAGDGPERAALEQRVAELELRGAFRFRGHLEQVSAFYQGLDVYLNTSRHEGVPMSILEAMAHGVPVVAPAVGGIVEIIDDGVDGFLVEGRCPEDFAVKCLCLQDPALRLRLGMAARQKIERLFSAQIMTESYLQLYRELAA